MFCTRSSKEVTSWTERCSCATKGKEFEKEKKKKKNENEKEKTLEVRLVWRVGALPVCWGLRPLGFFAED